jgi:hypothetical protein
MQNDHIWEHLVSTINYTYLLNNAYIVAVTKKISTTPKKVHD